jgi:hypothetical protein
MTGRRIPPTLKDCCQRFTVVCTILPRAEGEGFEPSVDRKAHNGFRDRAEPAAMPHHNWSLRPGGIHGGMNLSPPCGRRASAGESAGRRPTARARSIAQQTGLSVLVLAGANCASLRVPQVREGRRRQIRGGS